MTANSTTRRTLTTCKASIQCNACRKPMWYSLQLHQADTDPKHRWTSCRETRLSNGERFSMRNAKPARLLVKLCNPSQSRSFCFLQGCRLARVSEHRQLTKERNVAKRTDLHAKLQIHIAVKLPMSLPTKDASHNENRPGRQLVVLQCSNQMWWQTSR